MTLNIIRYSLLKYSIFLVEPSLRMGDLNANASASSMPPISSSAHSISTMGRMAATETVTVTRRAVDNRKQQLYRSRNYKRRRHGTTTVDVVAIFAIIAAKRIARKTE